MCACSVFTLTKISSAQTSIIIAATKAFNDHDIKKYISYFSDDAELYNTADYKEPAKGIQAIEQLIAGWFMLIPDVTTKVIRTYTYENIVIEEFEFSGTVKALLPGYPENLKDKSFNVKACSVTTLQDEKIKTINMYWDYLSLLNQLGWKNIVPGH